VKDLDEILTYLVSHIDGATAAFVGSSDGLLIEQYPVQGQDFSSVTAQWTNVLVNLNQVASGLKAGKLTESLMMTEKVVAYARLINSEIFCVVLMNPSGNIDKARALSQQISENLLEVFA
jgi:predicted regulator of Ras-like GTPase activity (Roadblock/LC7/MglB family)